MRALLLLGPLLLLVLPGQPARAGQVQLYGEVRASVFGIVGSPGQFGNGASGDACGANPGGDGGAYVNGTGVLLATSPRHRHRLGLSLGYFAVGCTQSLRRPLGGLDYRGRHQIDERTQIRSSLRANVDVFDRTLDIRLGAFDPEATAAAAAPTAGTVYLTGAGAVDIERWLRRGYAVRASASLQTMQLFTDVSRLAEFVTLGPMTSAEVQVEGVHLRGGGRDRLEAPLRYRVSHFYPVTLARDLPASKVPPALDASLRFAWERRLSQLLTVRAEAGLAIARQDHLCLPGAALRALGSCSVDQLAPGVRGAAGRPGGEALLGPQTTGTFIGELGVRYQSQRHLLEASFSRGYEPNAYASALDLVNRLTASAQLRPLPELLLNASLLFGHHGHTSPQRLGTIDPGDPDAARVSPQNRTMLMAQGSVGADWALRPPVALFVQTDAQAFAIRGEQVTSRDLQGLEDPARLVSGFPQNGDTYQTVWRLGFLVGVRVFTETPEREPALLQGARSIP